MKKSKTKGFTWEEVPDDVRAVMVYSQQPMGMERYKWCKKVIDDNPKWFPWEAKYNSIPDEVHEAYLDEAYPDRHKTFEPPIGVYKPFYSEPIPINTTEKLTVESINKFFDQMREKDKQRQKDIETELKRLEAIWDKHYAKFNLKFRK